MHKICTYGLMPQPVTHHKKCCDVSPHPPPNTTPSHPNTTPFRFHPNPLPPSLSLRSVRCLFPSPQPTPAPPSHLSLAAAALRVGARTKNAAVVSNAFVVLHSFILLANPVKMFGLQNAEQHQACFSFIAGITFGVSCAPSRAVPRPTV